jgi:hypothetical protein
MKKMNFSSRGVMAGVAFSVMLAVFAVSAFSADSTNRLQAIRFPQNPIIRPEMLPGKDGKNINGPSLICVPQWVPGRLGNYYLYFAHHSGQYIRLAYADDLHGPWKIYTPGVLQLAEAPACKGHIASPDAIVDEARHQIRMYFHGPARATGKQTSYVALSSDGLHFKAQDAPLGFFYFRVFSWGGKWYAMAKGGQLYRSKDGLSGFEKGGNPLPDGAARAGDDESANTPGPRHVALRLAGDTLWAYYSSIGDAPERILRRKIPLIPDWKAWQAGPAEEVLRPEAAYEGINLPLAKSVAGAARGPENALRDPAVFSDADGRVYLLYSVAGESGIGLAELKGE